MAVTVSLVFMRVEAFENKSTDDDVGVKVRDLAGGSDRDIVRFFSERIGCSCLKEMSKQVKSEPRLGLCSTCKQRNERRELMVLLFADCLSIAPKLARKLTGPSTEYFAIYI